MCLGQKVSSAPLKTQHHRKRGCWFTPPPPWQAPTRPPPPHTHHHGPEFPTNRVVRTTVITEMGKWGGGQHRSARDPSHGPHPFDRHRWGHPPDRRGPGSGRCKAWAAIVQQRCRPTRPSPVLSWRCDPKEHQNTAALRYDAALLPLTSGGRRVSHARGSMPCQPPQQQPCLHVVVAALVGCVQNRAPGPTRIAPADRPRHSPHTKRQLRWVLIYEPPVSFFGLHLLVLWATAPALPIASFCMIFSTSEAISGVYSVISASFWRLDMKAPRLLIVGGCSGQRTPQASHMAQQPSLQTLQSRWIASLRSSSSSRCCTQALPMPGHTAAWHIQSLSHPPHPDGEGTGGHMPQTVWSGRCQ